jgi:peptide deformylase
MPRSPKLLPIRIYGDETLRLKAEPVDQIDAELFDLAQDLIRTMYEFDGVGLAAPQAGVSRRIIVVDPHWGKDGKTPAPVVMLNPVLEYGSDETETEEGCISLPELYAKVIRPNRITVSFTDLQGEKRSMQLEGYQAVVIQHEYDHLEGVLFIDRLSTIARLKLKKKLKDMEKTAKNGVNIRSKP